MKSTTTTALLLLFSIGAIQCLNWSNITASELSNLSVSAFSSITIEELGSIPAEACQGFRYSQASNLNVSAAPGLKAECLANFPTDSTGGCAGLQAVFVGNMLPATFAGWTAKCTEQLPSMSFSQVKSEQWASMNSSACNGFKYSVAFNFNATSGGGMTADCLSQFSYTSDGLGGCTGLQAGFVSSINPDAFAGWTADCTRQLPSMSFSLVRGEQFAKINPAACSGFRYSTATNFNALGGTQLTAACLSQFSYTSDGLGGCTGLQAGFVGNINPAAFAGWTAKCTEQLPSMSFSQVKSEQWALMNSSACNGFKYSTVSNFNATSGGGMTADCLSQFSYTSDGLGGCTGLQAGFVSSINPDAFAGWTADCTRQLPSMSFSLVRGEQFAKINPAACSGFRYSTATNFNALGGTQLTAACLSQFSYTSDGLGGCTGLQAGFVGNINPAAFAGWTAKCTEQLPSMSFSQVKSEQWASMNSSACNGFKYSVASNFNATSASGVTEACLSQFSYTNDGLGGCTGLQAGFVSNLTPQAFSGFQAACISATPSMAFSKISSEQFASITASSCSGFRYSQASNFPPEAAPGVQIACLAAFSTTSDGLGGCSGLHGPFVGQMVPATFEAFTADCINAAYSSIFANINATQMSHITPLAFKGLGSSQVTNTPDQAWTGSSKSQLSYLTSNGFSGLRPSALKIVLDMYTLDLVNIFTVEQTNSYPLLWAYEFKSLIPAQVAYMTEWATVSQDLSTVTWLKIALLKKGDEQAVQGPVFNAETLKLLPFSSYEGLRADHVPLIAASAFKLLNQSHMRYLTNDTFAAVTADQLREISPNAFGAINSFAFSAINPNVVSAITGDQVVYLTAEQIRSMTCTQLQGFTMDQLNSFDGSQQSVYDRTYQSECHAAAPPFVAAPSYVPVAPIDSPVGGNSPSGQNQQLTGGQIFGIIAGVVLAVVVVGGVVFFFVRRRRSDPARRPLLSTPSSS